MVLLESLWSTCTHFRRHRSGLRDDGDDDVRANLEEQQSKLHWLAGQVGAQDPGIPWVLPGAPPLPVRGGDAKYRGRSGPNLGHAQLTREVFVAVVVISADLPAQWTGAGDALAIVSYCWFRDGPGVAHLERLLDTVQEGFIAAL